MWRKTIGSRSHLTTVCVSMCLLLPSTLSCRDFFDLWCLHGYVHKQLPDHVGYSRLRAYLELQSMGSDQRGDDHESVDLGLHRRNWKLASLKQQRAVFLVNHEHVHKHRHQRAHVRKMHDTNYSYDKLSDYNALHRTRRQTTVNRNRNMRSLFGNVFTTNAGQAGLWRR
jgi:hypothetical protein